MDHSFSCSRMRCAQLVFLVVWVLKKGECDGLSPTPFERRAQRLVRMLGEEEKSVRSDLDHLETRVLRRRAPAGSRMQISTTEAGTLEILLPAKRPSLDAALPATFTVTWLGFVGLWTAGALAASPVMAAFSLPFWLAGVRLASDTLIDPATSTTILIGQYAWEVRTTFLGKTVKQLLGSTEDLTDATVTIDGYVNEEPVTSLRLNEGVNQHRIAGLAPVEIEFLASLINDQIAHLQDSNALLSSPSDDPFFLESSSDPKRRRISSDNDDDLS